MSWLESIFQDLRYAFRMGRRRPLVNNRSGAFARAGNRRENGIFSVLDAFLLRSLPVKDPAQIVLLCSRE
jgi:hypothetical protein